MSHPRIKFGGGRCHAKVADLRVRGSRFRGALRSISRDLEVWRFRETMVEMQWGLLHLQRSKGLELQTDLEV